MSLVLTPAERRALRRATTLLDLDRGRLARSVLAGSLSLASAVGLSAVAAWLIARASQMPDVAALGVAPVAVRLFGVSRPVLRYCERLASHDTALAASRADVVAGLRRGDVLERVGRDVDAVGDLVVRAWLPMWVAGVVGAATSLGVALVHPPAGAVLAACLLLAGVVGPAATVRAARAAELARAEHATELSATVMTVLEGGGELAVNGRLAQAMDGLADLEGRLARARDRAARPAALAAAVDTLAMGLAVLGCLAVGVPAVASGTLDPVMLAVTVLVPLAAFEATSALGPASAQLVTSAGAAVRIVSLVESAEASTAALPAPRPLPPAPDGGPVLVARDLAVGWPGGPVVARGIDLELRPGRRLAVVGPSGVGKTTLLLTLAGLLEPRAGTLTLNGVAPWGAARQEVAAQVTLTAEDAHVFDTTVLENLRVARGDVTASQATALLERAGLGPWLACLPRGLDTPVSSDAATLAGGERRRLLLARALACPAPLMLLDEPGEHLDAGTADRLVADLLRAGAPTSGDGGATSGDAGAAGDGRGTLLVTHRLSALGHAEEVLVLGRTGSGPATIVRRGSHADLMSADADYRWTVSQEQSDD